MAIVCFGTLACQFMLNILAAISTKPDYVIYCKIIFLSDWSYCYLVSEVDD